MALAQAEKRRRNAAKQQRWRERNLIVLTAPAGQIARHLLAMSDRDKLAAIAAELGHLAAPATPAAPPAKAPVLPDDPFRVAHLIMDPRRYGVWLAELKLRPDVTVALIEGLTEGRRKRLAADRLPIDG